MIRHPILGCRSLGGGLVERLAGRGGTVTVVTDRQSRAENLRSDGIAAREGDPTSPSTYPDEVNLVVVGGGQSPQRDLDTARAAHNHYPNVLLVVYLDDDVDPSVRASICDLADKVIDPHRMITERIFSTVSTSHTERLNRLMRTLQNVGSRLAVMTRDNPDPDAVAAALVLQVTAGRADVDADVYYFGDISHQENRALVNPLGLDLHILNKVPMGDEYADFALVGHFRPGVNDRPPPETTTDIVIDHRLPRVPIEAACVGFRRGVDATSTLLAEYFGRFGTVPDMMAMTTPLFGIQVDINDFTQGVSAVSFEVATLLVPHVNVDLFEQVETPSLTSEAMETLAHAVPNRDVRGNVLTTNAGDIRERDVLAQTVDHLLGIEGVEVTIVYGLTDGTVYVSGRIRGVWVDLDKTFREALGSTKSAGGHADMAGTRIPLGILDDMGGDSQEPLATIVTGVVARRVFETLGHTTPTLSLSTDVVFEYPLDG